MATEGLKKTIMEAVYDLKVEGMKYTYNQADQLIERENLITGDYYEYAYDSRGNMTGDGAREYSYDSQDRMVKIVDEKGRATQYTYDSLGRRTASDFNGEVTKYYYLGDSGKVIKEIRPDGTEIGFSYDNEGSPLTMSHKGQTYFYVFNGHGDVVALTDASGAKVATYRYDPWGKALKPQDEEEKVDAGETAELPRDSVDIGEINPYRYAGYRYDTKTKLYFLKTRYYNPQLGRFLSKDKYVPETGVDGEETAIQPITQNKYIYVNDNPVNMIDPNGQWGFSVKSVVKSVKSAASRAASTVKSIAKSVSPKATISRVVKSGSRVAANIKANVSKVTAKAQLKINKAVKTVKSLTNPKTIRQKARAAVSGVKATMSSIKKMVSGKISKAEKFAGAQKLALFSAAKTAKGKMVKYAVPAAKNVASAVKQNIVDQVKFKVGVSLGVFDAAKITVTGLYKAGKYRATTDSKKIGQDVKTTFTGIQKDLERAYNNPKQTLKAIGTGLKNAGKAYVESDAMTRGRVVGRVAGEIGLAFVGTKGIDKIAKVAKGSQVAAKLGQVARANGGLSGLGRRLLVEEAGSLRLGAKGMGQASKVIPDEAFVRFDPIKVRGSISNSGIQKQFFAGEKVWFTKYKYVKDISNPAKLETHGGSRR